MNKTIALACTAALALGACALDYRDGQTCETHADCLDGYSCSEGECVSTTVPDVEVVMGSVREGTVTYLYGFDGYGGGHEYEMENLAMQYGTIMQIGPRQLLYTPTQVSPVGDEYSNYVDNGSYEISYTHDGSTVTVPIKVTVTHDQAPYLVGGTTNVLWDRTTALAWPVRDPDDELGSANVSVSTQALHGHALVGQDPGGNIAIEYTPTSGYFGPDSIGLTMNDSYRTTVGTLSVNVVCGYAEPDSAFTTWNDAVTVAVKGNDTINSANVEVATAPPHGTALVVGDTITYHAEHGFIGDDTFTYRRVTVEGCSASSTVTIHVRNPVEQIALSDPNGEVALSTDGNMVAYVARGLSVSGALWVGDGANGVTIKNRFAQEVSGVHRPHLSGDGRYLVFDTYAHDMIAAPDWVHLGDVYLLDRETGVLELISVAGAVGGNNQSWGAQVSDDGRYVSFISVASNLVSGDTNGVSDVFVRDRQAGTTELVSVATDGSRATVGAGPEARISADGNIVAFTGDTPSFGADGGGSADVIVRDRMAGMTSAIIAGNGGDVLLSRNGRFVAGSAQIYDRAGGTHQDANGVTSISDDGAMFARLQYVYDRQTGTHEDVCLDPLGRVPPNTPCSEIVVSGDASTLFYVSLYAMTNTSPQPSWSPGPGYLYRARH